MKAPTTISRKSSTLSFDHKVCIAFNLLNSSRHIFRKFRNLKLYSLLVNEATHLLKIGNKLYNDHEMIGQTVKLENHFPH